MAGKGEQTRQTNTRACTHARTSTSEEPTFMPRALRKVKTIPPPITSLSTCLMFVVWVGCGWETWQPRLSTTAPSHPSDPLINLSTNLVEEGLNDGDLGGDLGAADDGREGALGLGHGALEVVELLLEEEAGHGGLQVLGHAW